MKVAFFVFFNRIRTFIDRNRLILQEIFFRPREKSKDKKKGKEDEPVPRESVVHPSIIKEFLQRFPAYGTRLTLLMVQTALTDTVNWKKRVRISLKEFFARNVCFSLLKNIVCGTLNNFFNKKQVKLCFYSSFPSFILNLDGSCWWKITTINDRSSRHGTKKFFSFIRFQSVVFRCAMIRNHRKSNLYMLLLF